MSNFKISDLHTYIVKVAEKELNKSSFLDTVTTGTITASYPGYYQVSLTNSGDVSSVNALPMNDATYAINDYVYLLKAPAKGGDNFNNSYYIFGKVNETKETYANLTDWERFNGNLTTVKIDGGNVVTDSDYLEETFDNENLINDIKESGYFSVSGYFTADGSSDFGLIIELYNGDPNDSNSNASVIQTFKLDKNYFTGQTIALTNAYQKRICSITDESKLVALKAIKIKGFNNKTGDPQIQDIVITAGSMYEASNNLEVKVTTLSGYKDYFRNMVPTEAGQDQIGLKATLYYNNQPLAADNIRYYWCIKDTNTTAEDSLPFIEPGWRCLNGYSQVDFLGSEEKETVQVWKSSSSMIIDEFDGSFKNDLGQTIHSGEQKNEDGEVIQSGAYKNIFDKTYNNTVACFVKYNGRIFKSNEKNIINYNLHNFKVSLDLNSGNVSDVQKIIYENDEVAAHCSIIAEQDGKTLPLPQHAEYTYQWKIKANDLDITEYLKREDQNLNEILGYSKIIIKDEKTIDKTGSVTQSALDTLTIELPEFVDSHDIKNAIIKVSALISIKADGADSDAIELQTNEIQIESHTHELEQIHSVFSYKYYLSESMNVTFEKKAKIDGVWSGDWNIEDPNIDNDKSLDWISILAKDEWNATKLEYETKGFEELEKIKPNDSFDTSKKYYLYYTKQEDIFKYIGSEKEEDPLDSRTWQYPLVLNVFIWNGKWEKMSSVSVDQINTFNQFTQGGKENGIFYQEDSYVLTKDTTVQDGKTYYTVSFDNKGKPAYTQATFKTFEDGTKEGFAEGTSYYEKTDDKNRLYINATYINTGTLRVGSANNERFFTSVNEDIVRIAGWNVDDHSLTKGTVGINSDSTENDKIAFWAGSETAAAAPFSVTHDGHIKATKGTISGWILSKHPNSDEHNFLYNRQSSFGTGLSSTPTGDDPAFWAGFTGEGNTPWNDTQWSDKTNFYVTNNGKLVAKEADIIGHINATSLTLGDGVSIDYDDISNTPDPVDLTGYIYENGIVGKTPAEGATGFVVSDDGLLQASNAIIYGDLYASKGRIGGLTLENNVLSSNNFTIAADGKITATAGAIGGWTISKTLGPSSNESGLYSVRRDANGNVLNSTGMANAAGEDVVAFWAGCNKESPWKTGASTKFYITNHGKLVAKNADIEGTITATGGTFTGDIHAEGGTIGSLSLVNNNLTGTGFSLGTTNTGTSLVFSNSSGNPTTVINNTGITTNSYQAGKLIIRETGLYYGGASGMEGTEIQMAEQIANQSKSWTLTITAEQRNRTEGTTNKDIYVVGTLTGGPAPYELNYNVAVKMNSGAIVGSGQYNDLKTLTIKAGSTSGEVYMSYFNSRYTIEDYWFIDDNLKSKTITLGTNPHIGIKGTLAPLNDNECDLGYDSDGKRWRRVYTINGIQQSSDLRLKNTILALTDSYSTFFDNLKPVSYFFNYENNEKIHIGYIAQDVEAALIKSGLSSQNFSGLAVPDDINKEHYGLAYTEFIALNTHEIQKLKKHVIEQDQKILELEEKLLNFEKLIQTRGN